MGGREMLKGLTAPRSPLGAGSAKASFNFPEADGEELDALAPNSIESGFRYSLSYSVSDLKILKHDGS